MAGNGRSAVLECAHFVDAVDDDFVCPVCLEVFVEPMQCKEGHVFCKVCIEKTLQMKEECPMDRSKLQMADLGRVRALENMISRKRVRCPHASQHTDDADGCAWEGKVSERQKHLGDECEHTMAPCSHDRREVRVRRVAFQYAAACEQEAKRKKRAPAGIKKQQARYARYRQVKRYYAVMRWNAHLTGARPWVLA